MKKAALPYLIVSLCLLAALLLSVGVGSISIPIRDLFKVISAGLAGETLQSETLGSFYTIVWELRLPRTVLMLLVGASLAASGGAYQGVFRNPLADPYLIGVASGAGLGAVVAMSIRWPYTTLGLLAVPAAAFICGLATVAVVYLLARTGKTVPTTNLILAGVAISSFATALTSFLMINSTGELRRALVWLLGGSTLNGWRPVIAILPYVAVGICFLMTAGFRLNVLQFGDEQARQLGVPADRVRLLVIGGASLLAAAAVAFAGVIGFVGLIVPHIIRLLWGGDYRRLLPLSALGGAVLLLLADVLARILLAPQELPVGIVTSLAGAPFFLWLLRRTRRQQVW